MSNEPDQKSQMPVFRILGNEILINTGTPIMVFETFKRQNMRKTWGFHFFSFSLEKGILIDNIVQYIYTYSCQD